MDIRRMAGPVACAAVLSSFGAAGVAQGVTGQRVAGADTQFGLDLLSQLVRREPDRNVLVSPTSVRLALSMVYNGAGGETERAMAGTLRFGELTLDQVNEGSSAVRDELLRGGPGVEIGFANAVWVDQRDHMQPDFVERCTRYYGAEASVLDFRSADAADHINGWFGTHTQGKIPRMVSDNDLRPPVFAVLANAVYFKGAWARPFEARLTRDGEFQLANGTTKTLPMMRRTMDAKYLEDRDVQAISLPYGDGRFSMLVFLPRDPLDSFLKLLTPAKLRAWASGLRPAPVDLRLPRFKLDCAADLKPPLTALGMGIAFAPGADFRAMAGEGVFISAARHRAVMEVNEEGTVAAAATMVGMGRGGRPPAPAVMSVDKPFLCAIADGRTGVPVFLGVVRDPTRL